MKNTYKRLILTFLNSKTGKKKRVYFQIHDHEAAQFWAELLVEKFTLGCFLNKNYIFHGWPVRGRTFSELCRQMNLAIAGINDYFSKTDLKFKIKMKFSPETISQRKCNEIHRHFEDLMGYSWRPSEYFPLMDVGVLFDVFQLNWLAHEMECKLKNETVSKPSRETALYFSHYPMLSRKIPESFYQYLDPLLEWGDVYLHHSQLGKSLWEVYGHGDDVAGHENISVTQYMSGEFDVFLSRPHEGAREELQNEIPKMKKWLAEQKFDLTAPHMKIGFIKVAKIEKKQMKGLTRERFLRALHPFDSICEIGLVRENGAVVSKSYPIHWSDPKYKDLFVSSSRAALEAALVQEPAAIETLLRAAAEHGHEPHVFLKNLFEKLPHAHTFGDLSRLVPWSSYA